MIRVAAGCALALSVALGVAAIGVTPASAAKKSSKAQSASKALKAYTTCLAKHGVKLPRNFGHRPAGGFAGFGGSGTTPPTGSGGPPAGGFPGGGAARFGSNSKFAKAAKACASKRPKGAFGGFGGPAGGNFKPTAAQQAALTKFEQCMASHGVQIASNATFQTIRSLMQADPSAASACRSDLSGIFGRPGGAPAGSPTSTTS